MKSFNDWLDDNVASTREKLAAKEPQPTSEAKPETQDAGATFTVTGTSGHVLTGSSGWTPIHSALLLPSGVTFIEPTDPIDLARLRSVIGTIDPKLTGPFPAGTYVELLTSPGAAHVGAIARVHGYCQRHGIKFAVIEWSDDDKRRNRPGPSGTGQSHGLYYPTAFKQI